MKPPAASSGRPKSPEAFRTIGEAAAEIGVEPHVLRFWETKFTRLKPLTRAGGRRYYRPADIELLRKIRQLLHEDGMTIRGAQKVLQGRSAPDLLDGLSDTGGPEPFPSPAAPPSSGAPWNAQTAPTPGHRGQLLALAAEARSIANGAMPTDIPGTD